MLRENRITEELEAWSVSVIKRNTAGRNYSEQTKSFTISKRVLWNAYMRVRKNGGSAGVDGMTLVSMANREKDILYTLWNRMSSGSYFPKPVLRVDIPKKSGGTRPLGIPTVIDRIEHDLLLKAVEFHEPPAWVVLYIKRWLKVSAEDSNGTLIERKQGTPQGGVISPLLANLFMHYAFDEWMKREYPQVEFARYADDLVIHCRSRAEAESLLSEVKERFRACKLSVHPKKTKIVYCRDDNRKSDYENTEFDFLGFTFRPRHARSNRGQFFVSFSPAISRKAEKSVRDTIRSWRVHSRTGSSLLTFRKELTWFFRIKSWQSGCFILFTCR